MARNARKRRAAEPAPAPAAPQSIPPRPTQDAPALPEPLPITEEQARRADLLWAAGVTVAVVLLFLVLDLSKAAAVPVLVSLAFAYALDPAIDWLEARGLSRTWAIALLFAVAGVAVAGFLLYLVPAFAAEGAKLPGFFQDIAGKAVPRIEGLLGQPLPSNIRDAAATLSEKGGGVAQKALPAVASFAMSAVGGTASALVTIVGLLVIPVLSFYLLRDYDRNVAFARNLLPRRYESLIASRFAEVDSVLSSFIRGQLTVGAILTVIYAIGLSLAQLDLAVFIGAVAGFGTMIPYVGPAIGAGLALVSVAVSWQGPWQLLAVAGTFVVAMGSEGLFITPRIVGEKVGLSAVAVMIAVLVFGDLFGFVGVLLAVPVTACMKVVGKVVLLRYQRSRVYRGEP